MAQMDGFLLTRDWRDTPQGVQLTYWLATDRGPVKVVIPGQEAVCFFERDKLSAVRRVLAGMGLTQGAWRQREVQLRTPVGEFVNALYFRAQRDLTQFRDRARATPITLYESDIKPADRFLMERFVTGAVHARGPEPIPAQGQTGSLMLGPQLSASEYRPTLATISLDVEASDLDGDLYSIALTDGNQERVLLVDPDRTHARTDPFIIESYPDEATLLRAFVQRIEADDPDVLIGWNVIGFDLSYLEQRCRAAGIAFTLGRGGESATVLPGRGAGQIPIARIPGRAVLDGIESLRAAFWTFEDYSLDAVSRTLLGRGKLVHEGVDQVTAIRRLFASDKTRLAQYNLEDCRLVLDIFARTALIAFSIERAQITGLAFGRVGGSVAAFDHLYLPRLHRAGRVAPDPGSLGGAERTPSPGGYVLDSKPGLYRNVLLLDFKSLYPSIIRTFQIDPYGLWVPGEDPIQGFLGATFARGNGILPAIMRSLSARRDQAKRQSDAALSHAVKIIMNACYGVLASTGCRFFDPRLASSITRRGHEIIRRSEERIERAGYTVIYGDTDSLFVLLDEASDEATANAVGEKLAHDLNGWWTDTLAIEYQLESHLEVEFETHFLRFLMPTVRGSDTGTKKRYAGSVRTSTSDTALVFKGLETVRTDWTPLARAFQRELYRRIFADEPFHEFVADTERQLMAGELDRQLIYRKRIRRPLSEYKRNVPPHVQAARKQAKPGRWVSYIITRDGPEPTDNTDAVPDYEHYRLRQLGPAADSILHFLNTSFEKITSAQLAIF